MNVGAPQPGPRAGDTQGGPLAVAVVEDDAEVRSALAAAVLQSPGLRLVGAAGDVPEALALLQREQPDVALVDLGLPGGSGLAVIRAAVAQGTGCEVIVVSSLGDEMHVLAAIEAGATGYLLKDADPADLVAQIAVLRAGGSPVSPVIARRLLGRLGPARPAQGDEPAPELSLSAQEQQVLRLCTLGYSFDEIAERMGVSRHTVGTYVRRSYKKLQVHSKTEAVLLARERGLL